MVYGRALENEASMEKEFNELNIEMRQILTMKRSINPLPDIYSINTISKIIKEFKPDIIHTHTFKPGILGRIIANWNNVPIIIHTYHGLIFKSYFSSLLSSILVRTDRYLARYTDFIIALSENQKNDIAIKYNITSTNKIQVIPLSIEQNRNSFSKDLGIEYRNKIGLKPNTLLMAMVGRLVDVKNVAQSIRVFAKLKNSSEAKDVVLLIVGDGDLRKDLISLANSQGLNVGFNKAETADIDIIFVSWQRDLKGIYSAIDILVLSSKNEGTPLNIIEAQIAQTAILAPRVGGISDIVEENKTALLFNTEDQMLDQMKYYFDNKNIISEFAKNATNFACKKFSPIKIFNAYEELFSQKIINRKK